MATIELDHAVCIVSGMCASVAPSLFRVSDDNSEIVVLQTTVPEDLLDEAMNAEVCCPVEAILVVTG